MTSLASFLCLLLIPNNLTFYQAHLLFLFSYLSLLKFIADMTIFYPLPSPHGQLSLPSESSSRSFYSSNQSVCQPTFTVKLQTLLSWDVVTQDFQGEPPLAGIPHFIFWCLTLQRTLPKMKISTLSPRNSRKNQIWERKVLAVSEWPGIPMMFNKCFHQELGKSDVSMSLNSLHLKKSQNS